MYGRIENFLKSSDILYKYQFGFRRQHSTNHALLGIVEKIRSSLDKKMYTVVSFIDLEKAFGTVNHKILLSKLNHYGIRGTAKLMVLLILVIQISISNAKWCNVIT